MPGKKLMKAQAEERLLFLMGVIVICLIAIVLVLGITFPSLESSREGQAKAMANVIAISANTLATMDAGRVEKDFSQAQGSKPLTVEVYDKGGNGVMYVKVTYDEADKKSYETPILAKVEPLAPVSLNRVYVVKSSGKIYVKGEAGWLPPSGDQPCLEPTPEEKDKYIKEIASKYGVDENLIKSVILQETGGKFLQCKSDGRYTESGKGALGLMQLTPIAIEEIYRKDKIIIEPKDWQQNIQGGTIYLSYQLKDPVFAGNRNLALAAYNGGPPTVKGCMSTCGLSSQSAPEDIKGCYCLPKETRDYVPGVMSYYNLCYASAACSQQECKLC